MPMFIIVAAEASGEVGVGVAVGGGGWGEVALPFSKAKDFM